MNNSKRVIKALPLNYVQSSFGVSSHSLKYSNTFKNLDIQLPSESTNNNIELNNQIKKNKKVSIIYLHGLFGSSDNFRLTNKLLIEKFNYGFMDFLPPLIKSPDPLNQLLYPLPSQEIISSFVSPSNKDINVDIFSLDLRNHGSSPHSQEMTLKHIEKDLHYFIDRIILNNNKEKHPDSKIILVGHSMGGKANMLFSLNNPDLIDGLVNIDVSPSNYVGIHNHDSKFNAMLEAEKLFQDSNTTKNDIDLVMQKYNLNKGERLYLLNNLIEDNSNGNNKFKWRVNVGSLFENQNKLLSFPKLSTNKQFNKKVLFIGGGDSHYLKEPFRASIHQLFPNHEIHLLPQTSHFCFAEKTKDFNQILYLYLKNIINK